MQLRVEIPGKWNTVVLIPKLPNHFFTKVLFNREPIMWANFWLLVHGLAFLKKHKSDRILYTDSRIAMGWVKKKEMQYQAQTNMQEQKALRTNFTCRKMVENIIPITTKIVKWETKAWGEIPADFGRK